MSVYGYAVVVIHCDMSTEVWDSMLAFASDRGFNPSTVTKRIAERGEFCFDGSVVRRLKVNERTDVVTFPEPDGMVNREPVMPVGAGVNFFGESFTI